MEEEKVDLDKDTYYDSGSIGVDGATIHCWKHGGHGAQTFLEVVQNSCNLGGSTGTRLLRKIKKNERMRNIVV